MNNNSFSLMTYYLLVKELIGIKKFNQPIKIFNFYSTFTEVNSIQIIFISISQEET